MKEKKKTPVVICGINQISIDKISFKDITVAAFASV